MLKFKKICQILLLPAFVCAFSGSAHAQALTATNSSGINADGTMSWDKFENKDPFIKAPQQSGKEGISLADCQKTCTKSGHQCVYDSSGNTKNYVCVDYSKKSDSADTTKPAGTSDTHKSSSVTGCSADFGLFSGLIQTGRDIFSGLRDLIYVVAGFGIIGVAVGGFFGNLNWKWLGAIVIALVVIASTGEIINMITGCTNFSQSMITDTLK